MTDHHSFGFSENSRTQKWRVSLIGLALKSFSFVFMGTHFHGGIHKVLLRHLLVSFSVVTLYMLNRLYSVDKEIYYRIYCIRQNKSQWDSTMAADSFFPSSALHFKLLCCLSSPERLLTHHWNGKVRLKGFWNNIFFKECTYDSFKIEQGEKILLWSATHDKWLSFSQWIFNQFTCRMPTWDMGFHISYVRHVLWQCCALAIGQKKVLWSLWQQNWK